MPGKQLVLYEQQPELTLPRHLQFWAPGRTYIIFLTNLSTVLSYLLPYQLLVPARLPDYLIELLDYLFPQTGFLDSTKHRSNTFHCTLINPHPSSKEPPEERATRIAQHRHSGADCQRQPPHAP